ncbi:MAG: hypothetical protein RIC93_02495, partial [Alphaproteobacteria bacterium]
MKLQKGIKFRNLTGRTGQVAFNKGHDTVQNNETTSLPRRTSMALRLNQPVLALFAGLTIAAGAGGATADDHMAAPAADGLYGAIGGGAT